jgi:aryl-alcohol dehydrogenase-like predicted oxidoreductase
MDDLRREGLVHAVGVSINRWEPWNGLRTLRTGLVDAVQVIYNIFDQAPEDELFPLCRELDIGVIARVPFDEGSLTGTLTKDSTWPEGRLARHLLRAGEPDPDGASTRTRSSRSCPRARRCRTWRSASSWRIPTSTS